MNQPKLKKKPHALSRALSDQELQNHPYSIKRKLISTSRGELQDIYENKNGLHFEVACTGLSKEDIEINIEGDILKVSYQKIENKSYDLDEHNYIQKGIARRSFNLGYKIASRFNLSEANAEMKNGLLVISIPLSEEAKPKSLKIK